MKTKERSILIIRRASVLLNHTLKNNCLSNHNKKRGYVESKFPFLVKILCSHRTIQKMVDYCTRCIKNTFHTRDIF